MHQDVEVSGLQIRHRRMTRLPNRVRKVTCCVQSGRSHKVKEITVLINLRKERITALVRLMLKSRENMQFYGTQRGTMAFFVNPPNL